MELTPVIRLTESLVPIFIFTVRSVSCEQRLRGEHLFCLRSSHSMLFQTLTEISQVPIETLDLAKVNHVCIL